MRVLQIIHSFYSGGAEALVKDYLLYMKKMGVDCRALCYNYRKDSPFTKQLEDAGVTVMYALDGLPSWLSDLRILYKIAGKVCFYLETKRAIHQWKPDVIHAHLQVNRYLCYSLGKKPFYSESGKRVALWYTAHSEPDALWYKKQTPLEFIKSKTELHATKKLVRYHKMRFIALHDRMREDINQIFHVENTVVLNNGIDFERFEKLRPSCEVRADLNIPENAFLVGHVGRMSGEKNHGKIIQVFKEVHKRIPNSYLLLIGSGKLEGEIRNNIAESGLQDCTIILSNRGDVPDLMNAMNVFLFPSIDEGLGIVLIEAQKCGVPCVISEAVPRRAIISNYVRRMELSSDDKKWADAVTIPFPPNIIYENLEDWDMRHVTEKLLTLYNGEQI